jgi:hypothetical protein
MKRKYIKLIDSVIMSSKFKLSFKFTLISFKKERLYLNSDIKLNYYFYYIKIK